MGAVMYGDIIPFAMSEQLIDFVDMFACRLFLAFLFAESASYLSRMHNAQTTHTNRLQRIKDWSQLNHFPMELTSRIVRFYEILWKNFRGVRQASIIKNLPATLRMDVKQHIFKSIVDNWDVVLGITDKGILASIIHKLEIRIMPNHEYIIKFGELAQSMYFIVKGQVYVVSDEGINLATLGVGKYFGEMALVAESNV
jgi:cyclic nucleotide gated channel